MLNQYWPNSRFKEFDLGGPILGCRQMARTDRNSEDRNDSEWLYFHLFSLNTIATLPKSVLSQPPVCQDDLGQDDSRKVGHALSALIATDAVLEEPTTTAV